MDKTEKKPVHRFSGEPGPGRKKSSWSGFSTDLKSALHKLGPDDVTKKAAIINQLIDIALYDEKSDTRLKAIDMILNRCDGAPKQAIELSASKPADEWSREELDARLAQAGLVAASRLHNPLDAIEVHALDGEFIEAQEAGQ